MVDKLEAMLARWPVLIALLVGACSLGGTLATIAFLGSELTAARLETASAKGEAIAARVEAHDAQTGQAAMKREIDVLAIRIFRVESNVTFGREKTP